MQKRSKKSNPYQREIETFAVNVKNLRKIRNLTQLKLSELSGMDEKQVGFIEQALRSPNFRTILALRKGLGVKLMELFKDICD